MPRIHATPESKRVKPASPTPATRPEGKPPSHATAASGAGFDFSKVRILAAPGDRHEHEADRLADEVTRGGGASAAAHGLGRRPGAEPLPSVLFGAQSGQPLDEGTRAKMEPAFGRSFADVRLHTDAHASALSSRLDASAFTSGGHVAFGAGEYRPGTRDGDKLLAHELAHVTQAHPPDVVHRVIRPHNVSPEMQSHDFTLTDDFKVGKLTLAAGETVTVAASWVNSAATASVTSSKVKGAFDVPKNLLAPVSPSGTGMDAYGVDLAAVEAKNKAGAKEVADWEATKGSYKTPKAVKLFNEELKRRQELQAKRDVLLNDRLIQGEMINRLDPLIKKWVAFYNKKFGWDKSDPLDPNLVKSMVFQESQMGTSGSFMSDPVGATEPWGTRFNVLQAIDSFSEQQVIMMNEDAPALITKYHLADISKDFSAVQSELEKLKKVKKPSPAQTTRLAALETMRKSNWWGFFSAYRAPGQSTGFWEAVLEFLTTPRTGAPQRNLDYDFWIETGVRWLFEKRKGTSSWAEAIVAYNGSGKKAAAYGAAVQKRAADAASAAKAKTEYVPPGL